MRRALLLAGGALRNGASARAAAPSAARSFADAASDAPAAAPPAVDDKSTAALRRWRIKARKEPPPLGEGSVLRLRNVPRFALRTELAALLTAAGAPVTPDQLRLTYDHRMRPEHWFVQLPPSPPPSEVITKLRASALALGARKLVVDAVEELPGTPPEVAGHLGRAVIVSWLPPTSSAKDVAAAFAAYRLVRGVPGGSVSMLRTAPPLPHQHSPAGATALVRFATEVDALAAARDMHRAQLGESRIEVRYLQ